MKFTAQIVVSLSALGLVSTVNAQEEIGRCLADENGNPTGAGCGSIDVNAAMTEEKLSA